jgi:biotin/methionine sulfoxide reductase
MTSTTFPTSTHWGNFLLEKTEEKLTAVTPVSDDTNPSPIGRSLLDSQHRGCRIARPSIRRSYLEKRWQSDGSKRGAEPFVEVPWDEALDLAADALSHVKTEYGNASIYGGSYGWASAGRFHHSQSQLHRFLKMFGGYTGSVQSYSTGAMNIILPHVMGISHMQLMYEAPTIDDIIKHTRLIVSFGGVSMKNMQINQGGIGNHSARDQLLGIKQKGIDVVCVSPVRADTPEFLDADWWPLIPNTDVALMLGLAHTLYENDLHDKAFLKSHCTGFDHFCEYLTGAADGQPKDADWAAAICDIDAARIRALALRMASEPTLLSISWSLQRTEHGEQPYWMICTLAAMLGNFGLPGQGVGYGYGCLHNFGFAGRHPLPFKAGEFPQGQNPIGEYIPVARVADLLLHPGEQYRFNGETRTYPDTHLVYWAGGNPFHHHQDLNRLRRAWSKPGTIIVHEPVWTATARYADIVFPATTALEREDFSCGTADLCLSPMHRVLEPYAEARDDFEIFSALAERLQFAETFTEGRSAREWVEHLWQTTVDRARDVGVELPAFDDFWNGGQYIIDTARVEPIEFALEKFRRNPDDAPLNTPSGKIEIYSETLASFALPDCGGHARWQVKEELMGSARAQQFPIALNSNQPVTKLHSQLDFGSTSVRAKKQHREVARINPVDAAARSIDSGDIIRLYNDRGACLASALISDGVRAGVVVLPTGAWYNPQDNSVFDSLEVHGNPNVLTRDAGTSELGQATSAHSCMVEIEKFSGPLPDVTVFDQPEFSPRR